MSSYIETGLGTATNGPEYEMGLNAAKEALSQLDRFEPSLVTVFVSPELDIEEIHKGICKVLGDFPIIGSSTGGEFANGPLIKSVVVAILASPHLKVRVGIGSNVSLDYKIAVNDALEDAKISDYFNSEHPLHQMLNMSAPGIPGISPVFLMTFAPGTTESRASLTHDIHDYLRKSSSNRIPTFGGSSGDYLIYKNNFQIVNKKVCSDSVAIAFVEAEILFGLGMTHGYYPTTKGALITKASGHIVNELDGRKAVEVFSELLEIPLDKLYEGSMPLTRFPFGTNDIYGNSLLYVAEKILKNGSIQFGPIMRENQVITLMKGTNKDIMDASLSAYNKAIKNGGLKKPKLAILCSCALRKRNYPLLNEITPIRNKTDIHVTGFYSFGEIGVSDDGLPIYANQSASVLVFSDELNPVASLIHKSKRTYREFSSQLEKKASQIKAISKINKLIHECSDYKVLLQILSQELKDIFPWAENAFYLPTENLEIYTAANASDLKLPEKVNIKELKSPYLPVFLDSYEKRLGLLVLKKKGSSPGPDDEEILLAETIGSLTASGLHRLDLDGRLDIKLKQLDILNYLGSEFSRAISSNSQARNILKHIRDTLKLSFASLWLIDSAHKILVKEAIDVKTDLLLSDNAIENDEKIAKWQIDNRRPVFYAISNTEPCPVEIGPQSSYSFTSLPILYKGKLRGILNLFTKSQYRWAFQHEMMSENIDFLNGIAAQVSIFIENKTLHKHATFYKEIHHRVKNNLQNIASLLRMQLRRLDKVTAEQALSDSITRIMSMAIVHENLSNNEIGMVDLSYLIGSISKLSTTDTFNEPVVTLDVSGTSLMIPSREATSLALVVNELIQNAVEHGFRKEERGKLYIRVMKDNGYVRVKVQDNGPGLPGGFDPEKDCNLGLTIVRTLIEDELKGNFYLNCKAGTTAEVAFPLPTQYYSI